MMKPYLSGDVLYQRLSVAFALLTGSRAEVDEVVAFGVSLAEHVTFRVVQQREELGEEAFAAFGGELVIHPPETAAEQGAPVLDVFSRGEPGGVVSIIAGREWWQVAVPYGHAGIIRPDGGDESIVDMRGGHVVHVLDVELLLTLGAEVSHIWGINAVSNR